MHDSLQSGRSRHAEEVARRSPAPDYVIIVNEQLAAQQMLQMLKTLARSPAKMFVMHNDLTPEQQREIGNERQQIKNWIGTERRRRTPRGAATSCHNAGRGSER